MVGEQVKVEIEGEMYMLSITEPYDEDGDAIGKIVVGDIDAPYVSGEEVMFNIEQVKG